MPRREPTLANALEALEGLMRPHTFQHRDREVYGPVELSIQASAGHYCTPREYRENLDDYEAVEVAIFIDGNWADPSDLGLPSEIDDLWDTGECPVGGYIPLATVNLIREAAKNYAATR